MKQICDQHHAPKQRYFDFQLAAFMLLAGIPEIVTENATDFPAIPGIHVINPFR
jgi:predicted nucleic acid-binding protein